MVRSSSKYSSKYTDLTRVALLAALAVIMHTVEALLPPLIIGVPVKLGLANVFTLLALIMYGGSYALMVNIVRCIVGTLISGSASSLPYSLAGAFLSLAVMVVLEQLRRKGRVTAVGMSVAGSFMFNLGQLGVGCIIVGKAMLAYFPLLTLLSVPTGVFTGFIAYFASTTIKKHISKEE